MRWGNLGSRTYPAVESVIQDAMQENMSSTERGYRDLVTMGTEDILALECTPGLERASRAIFTHVRLWLWFGFVC